MTHDEIAIRTLMTTWHEATHKGDLLTLLALMADDVLFLQPGNDPMSKREFANIFSDMLGKVDITITKSEINDLIIEANKAYCWSYLEVHIKPKVMSDTQSNVGSKNKVVRRKGCVFSVYRKEAESWLLLRDANMQTVDLS